MRVHILGAALLLCATILAVAAPVQADAGASSRCNPVWIDSNLNPHVDPTCLPVDPSEIIVVLGIVCTTTHLC